MKFITLPIGKFFIHKDAAGRYYGWRKFNCLSARRVTKTGVTYGEPVVFDLAEETLLYEGDLTVDLWEYWEREVRQEATAEASWRYRWLLSVQTTQPWAVVR